jgi:hypothetical protein
MSSTRWGLDGPSGEQRPRVSHVPEYVSSAGEEAIELAAAARLHLDDWEQFVLVGGLGEREVGGVRGRHRRSPSERQGVDP